MDEKQEKLVSAAEDVLANSPDPSARLLALHVMNTTAPKRRRQRAIHAEVRLMCELLENDGDLPKMTIYHHLAETYSLSEDSVRRIVRNHRARHPRRHIRVPREGLVSLGDKLPNV